MTWKDVADVLSSLAWLVWALLAFYVVWLLGGSLTGMVDRLTGFEAWGVKFALGDGVMLPLIFYVGVLNAAAGVPPGAFGITNRPDLLLTLAGDALARVGRG